MALRIPKAALPAELRESMIEQLGAVPESVEVLWHNPKVTQDNVVLGGRVGAWDAAGASLTSFAHMAVAAQVGCSYGRPPTRRTCFRSPGCGGPASTTRRFVTRGRTSSGSSPGKRSTGCGRWRAAARNTSASGCRNRC